MGTRHKTGHAEVLVAEFGHLQGKLVEAFVQTYAPKDSARFSDVARGGTLAVDGIVWVQSRHGAGVTFTSEAGEVNAHVGMVAHPTGVDGFRVAEWISSLGVTSVWYRGIEVVVDREAFERILDDMERRGVMVRVECRCASAHRLYAWRHS